MAEPAPDWRAALERLRGAFADTTLRAYVDHFGQFEAWRAARGRGRLPAPPEEVAAFLDDCFEQGASAATAAAKMHAIRRTHHALRLPDPTLDQAVWLALRRGKRAAGPPVQAIPLNAALRDRLLAACGGDLLGLRDRAMLRLGYDTLCRRQELCRLRLEDLEPLGDGTARIWVRHGKTDLAAAGEAAFLSAQAWAAVDAWAAAAGLREGPILRALSRGREGWPLIDPQTVQNRLRALARAAGVAEAIAGRLTGHSFRVGAAQDLAAAGCSLLQIMAAGRWRSPEQVMAYVRRGSFNAWGERDGDAYALAVQGQVWRRRALRLRVHPLAVAAEHPVRAVRTQAPAPRGPSGPAAAGGEGADGG